MKKKRRILCFLEGSMGKNILLKMKLLTVLMLGLVAVSTANNTYSQATKFVLNLNDVSVKQVFQEIEENSEFILLYNEKDVDVNRRVNIRVNNETVESVLDQIFKKTLNVYKIYDRQIVILEDENADFPAILKQKVNEVESPQPQQERITGTVTDADGFPLPGASITVKGTTIGTVTNSDGEFELSVLDASDATLVFSFVGFDPQEIPVNGQPEFNVVLTESTVGLNEVVVTALGINREAKSLSYSQQGVNVESMNEAKSTNIVNSLAGKVAGVQIVPSGYNTGSSRIVIRGNSSLTGNNQPLFVVDGMPIDNTSGEEGSLDYGNNAASLNPEDIESIEVLKGPNASALYGSRAANGVILITSKKGTSGFKISVNSNIMFQTITEYPKYQNAYGVGTSFYIDRTHMFPEGAVNYRSWGSPMLGQPYIAINGERKSYLPQPNNVENFYQTAHLFTNTVIAEGGSKDHIARFSYTNYSGTSVVENLNENKRHNLNLGLQNKFNKWLSLDSKINFIRDQVDNRQYSNDSRRNPTYAYTHMARTTQLSELVPWKDELTGTEIGTHRNFPNPYWIINEDKNEDTRDRLITSFNPQLVFADWFKITGRIGTDIYWFRGFEFREIGSQVAGNPNGYLRTFDRSDQNINIEAIGTINKNFKDFSLVVNFGATRYDRKFENKNIVINSLLQPGLINLSNAREFPEVSQEIRRKRINSAFGAISLGFKDFAYIDITGRNDWSSTLPPENNSYFYPSFGSSLIFTEMLNIDSKILSFGKLRASYAIVGNDTDPYRLQQTFSFDGFFDESTIASLSTTMNNPDLKPEKTVSYEVGADLRFFNNRLTIDATYYNSVTTNQIITASLPHSSGFESRLYNAGEIKNWGIETSLQGKVVDTRNFSWDTQFNFSKNNSLVVRLIEGVPRFQLDRHSSYLFVYAEEGKPYAYLRGLGVKRDEQGRMLLEDGGGRLERDTDMAFGTATPDWLAGFGNTFKFKGFDLYSLFDLRTGGVMYSRTISRMLTNGMLAETLYGRDDYYRSTVIWGESGDELTGGARWDAWFADGTPNTRFMSPQSYEYARPNFAEFVIYDASFIKLREVSLGYNFASQILSGTPLRSARIALTGRNLWTLHKNTPQGIDPEAAATAGNGQGIENGSLPPNAMYGFNVRLIFK